MKSTFTVRIRRINARKGAKPSFTRTRGIETLNRRELKISKDRERKRDRNSYQIKGKLTGKKEQCPTHDPESRCYLSRSTIGKLQFKRFPYQKRQTRAKASQILTRPRRSIDKNKKEKKNLEGKKSTVLSISRGIPIDRMTPTEDESRDQSKDTVYSSSLCCLIGYDPSRGSGSSPPNPVGQMLSCHVHLVFHD